MAPRGDSVIPTAAVAGAVPSSPAVVDAVGPYPMRSVARAPVVTLVVPTAAVEGGVPSDTTVGDTVGMESLQGERAQCLPVRRSWTR